MAHLIHEDLSREIIAAAMKVHGTLRPGLDEKLYENALIIELAKRGHRADQQKSFSVHYDGHFIGKMTPDVIGTILSSWIRKSWMTSTKITSLKCSATLQSAGYK